MTDLTSSLAALDAAMDGCPHYAHRDGWTLETEGEFAGMWVHAKTTCRRPSAPTLLRMRS